jgi:signal transduction histidine kinase
MRILTNDLDVPHGGHRDARSRAHRSRGSSPRVGLLSRLMPGERVGTRPMARLERVLAVGRAFLTVSALTAIYLDPAQPARLAAITYAVLAGYALYSVIVFLYVHRAARITVTDRHVLHGCDVLWTAALTFVSEGPVSPFFLFFLFVVLSAAYRWGFMGTIATTCVTVAVFLVQTLVAAAGPWRHTWLASMDFELNETILRVAYLLLTGFLLGYLAEQEKQSQAELGTIADLMRQPRVDLGLGGSVVSVAHTLLRTFDAACVYFVLQDRETRLASMWRLDRSTPEATDRARLELSGEDQRAWLFPDPGRVWSADLRAGTQLTARVVDPEAWPLRQLSVELPDAIADDVPFTRVIVANFGMQDQWRGRVYLFDPGRSAHSDQSVHFLDALADYITPALTNVVLLGRLRARATAEERARVARELHDGAIQSLVGIEMKVAALRRRRPPPPTLDPDLGDIQESLRREALALRELMQALRPIALDTGDQLPDVLASLVERFRRDTGLPARFVFTGGSVALAPAVALEVVRIVQEALVNVRKHSHARNVLVRLGGGEDECSLVIEDDGSGFDFEGRLTREELDQRRLGPSIIKERARIAGAKLVIDSSRLSGARIELTVPSVALV